MPLPFPVQALKVVKYGFRRDAVQGLPPGLLRTALAEVWTPMPWSLRSREELLAIPDKIPGSSTPTSLTLGEDDLYRVDNPDIMTSVQSILGSPIDIPWLDAPHDGYPFCETLTQCTQTQLFRALHSVHDDLALWVSALTFGLLEAVMQTRIPEALLLSTGQGGAHIISGIHLQRLIMTWLVTRSESRPEPTADPHLQDEWQNYGRLVSGPGASIEKYAHTRDWQQASEDIRLGISIMLLTLSLTVMVLWHDVPEVASLLGPRCVTGAMLRGMVIAFCQRKMRHNRWCPHFVTDVASTQFVFLSAPCLLQLPQLLPFIRSSSDGHRDCTKSACSFYTFDTATYAARHVHPSCSCNHITPPVEEVTRFLSNGVIPVLVYNGSRLLARSSITGPYVAISHVWADGMGSTAEEGLPLCIVERISGLATSLLPESKAFWMDSLCIPAEGGSAPREQNLLQITFSGWNKRVWTLQEGLLARELWFEFIEGPVNIDQGLPSLHLSLNMQLARALSLPHTHSAAESTMPGGTVFNVGITHADPEVAANSPYICGLIKDLLHRDQVVPLLHYRTEHRRTSSNSASTAVLLDEIMGLLRGRSTTKPEDETLAISFLLAPQIDLDALLSITGPDSHQRRMKALLIQMHKLPVAFTKMPMRRLTIPKFSWAP
ncbi:hypothetical protein C8Q78DRAFT_991853 [Trametes maxima]|nr:hypothetical protein C8Q78DRAFT_991853 [Trametes maxima]